MNISIEYVLHIYLYSVRIRHKKLVIHSGCSRVSFIRETNFINFQKREKEKQVPLGNAIASGPFWG